MSQVFEELAEELAEELVEELVEELAEERAEEKKIEVLLDAVKGLMQSMKWTAEQAMTAMNLSEKDQAILKTKI